MRCTRLTRRSSRRNCSRRVTNSACCSRTWQGLNPNFLTYHDIVRRHAELLEANKAAAPAYAARSVELAAAVAVPVWAVPRTNSRKRAARQR
jgi:hypothetical protein